MGAGVTGLLARARRAAQRRGQRVTTGHVLLVLLQGEGVAGRLLASRGVREMDFLSALKVVDDEPPSALEVAVERAEKLARALEDGRLRAIHLLLAIVRDPRTVGYRCLEQIDTGAAPVAREATELLGAAPASGSARPAAARPERPPSRPARPRKHVGTLGPDRPAVRHPTLPRPRVSKPSTPMPLPSPEAIITADPPSPAAMIEALDAPPVTEPSPGRKRPAARRPPGPSRGPFELDEDDFPALSTLGRNLTALAAEGRIDPVVGREREIEQLLDVLARRRANNPLLVGPPGVGKTAIVEGLALRLACGDSGVHGLEGRIVVELTAGAIVSGTAVRGALAERIQLVREEVQRSEGRIILFIDEIHAVLGGSEGPDDLASELKASLSRGELPCIGATTEAEYRRHVERDPALARRFSRIVVEEPSPEDTRRILEGLVPRYEAHHGVTYAPEAISGAVDMAVRYMTERHLPDKAIGVLDLAAARVRRRGGKVVDVPAVAGVVAEEARVPVERLLMRDAERLLELERLIGETVVGHGSAIGRIGHALRKGAAGFRGQRPLGTFLLLGPTGVGKTEVAKAVAKVLFPDGAMTRLDMSEYAEAHAVARLVGAPPGYVGHEDGGHLTEAVRRRPYQLLLLDEVEKAHRDVLLALLPLLDEGRLTDGRGRTVDFTHTVIFMTSNLGVSVPATTGPRIGFGATSAPERVHDVGARVLEAARRALPPELWNRIDEPLHFGALSREEVREIARRMLASVGRTLESEQSVAFEVAEGAVEVLIDAGGFDPELGARPMRRTISRLVEAPLAEAVLRGTLRAGDRVRLVADGDVVRLQSLSDVDVDAAE